jgi:hypothetical protein
MPLTAKCELVEDVPFPGVKNGDGKADDGVVELPLMASLMWPLEEKNEWVVENGGGIVKSGGGGDRTRDCCT